MGKFKAKEDKENKSKDSKLDKTSSDEIKSQGTGAESKSNSSKGSRFNKKNKSGGAHRRFKSNDPSWYVANPNIVKDVASLPFAVYNGMVYDNFANVGNNTKNDKSNFAASVPGVAVYKYAPWYGTASPTSALNLTMRALYSFVRHVNSGRTNYEAPDLMIYVMAMDNVYLLIHEIKRLLRLAYLYVLENRDIPERVFSVMGIDQLDAVGNLANYRAQLNIRIAKANSLAVPANFNIFKRRAVLGSVILTDEPNRPTQLIVPMSDGFYKYNPRTGVGSTLEWVFPGANSQTAIGAEHKRAGADSLFIKQKTTINEYFQLLDSMLTVLLADEDINIMSGDIIKAYGDNLYKIPFMEDNEIQDIIHDENLLLQFTNSTVLDIPTASFGSFWATSNDKGLLAGANLVKFETDNPQSPSEMPIITQKDGSIIARCFANVLDTYENKKMSTSNSAPLVMMDRIFLDTTEASSISPENVMEWSRLTMMFRPHMGLTAIWNLEAGVEIGLGWLVAQPGYTVTLQNNFPSVVDTRTLSTQWFQFGRRSSLQTKVAMPTITGALPQDRAQYLTFVSQGTLNVSFNNTNVTATKYNSMFASRFIEGLSFGPKAYEVGAITYKTGGLVVQGDLAYGKFGEKTAIAHRDNITAMHDAALLGLISSPYVTTSK